MTVYSSWIVHLFQLPALFRHCILKAIFPFDRCGSAAGIFISLKPSLTSFQLNGPQQKKFILNFTLCNFHFSLSVKNSTEI
jgi:hypothetical protein